MEELGRRLERERGNLKNDWTSPDKNVTLRATSVVNIAQVWVQSRQVSFRILVSAVLLSDKSSWKWFDATLKAFEVKQ